MVDLSIVGGDELMAWHWPWRESVLSFLVLILFPFHSRRLVVRVACGRTVRMILKLLGSAKVVGGSCDVRLRAV